jgi:Domain of unknown function (DUF6429)
MKLDENRIADAVLALLAAYSFDNGRAWKGYDFNILDRLFAQGYIHDCKDKNKSLYLTDEGLQRGQALAQALFAERD